jgi:hypothetical protein
MTRIVAIGGGVLIEASATWAVAVSGARVERPTTSGNSRRYRLLSRDAHTSEKPD